MTPIALRLLACLVAGTSATALHAQGQPKLPAAVQKAIGAMTSMCKESGGRPGKSPDLLTIAELTGDERPDYVIDQSAFVCDGAPSLFGGSGGSQVAVFVGTADGQAAPAFAGGAFGVQVDRAVKPARVSLIVGGPMCGQKITANTPRSDYKSCWRPLVWNAGARKMDFAPLSQARPVQ
jgi:hypothetical protein